MLGAILVLLSLIVGPFFQQSIAYFEQSLETRNTTAYVSVASSYAGDSGHMTVNGTAKGKSI
jgi:hypothetical protein